MKFKNSIRDCLNSRAEDGAFCRACAVFAPELAGGHYTGQFVTAPLRTWRKLSDRTLAHGKLDYHLASLTKMSAFLDCYSDPSQALDTVLVSEARKRMEANKKVISSLLKIVLLCGRKA